MADSLANIKIVLINTTHPGNIGATARAMKVMGLSSLHLVTPAEYPNAQATALASGADDLLRDAVVHENLDSAIADCSLVLGSSARMRSLPMPQLDARNGAAQAVSEAGQGPVAILFGRERYGLTNDEMQRCHYLVHIPSNSEYGSLNLAQAVQVMCYELRMAEIGDSEQVPAPLDYEPVPDAQMELLYEHLEQALKDIRFLNPDQPKMLLTRLRRLFGRARPDQNEVNILRGILSAAQKSANRETD